VARSKSATPSPSPYPSFSTKTSPAGRLPLPAASVYTVQHPPKFSPSVHGLVVAPSPHLVYKRGHGVEGRDELALLQSKVEEGDTTVGAIVSGFGSVWRERSEEEQDAGGKPPFLLARLTLLPKLRNEEIKRLQGERESEND
jgi:hypothetical protein